MVYDLTATVYYFDGRESDVDELGGFPSSQEARAAAEEYLWDMYGAEILGDFRSGRPIRVNPNIKVIFTISKVST